MRTQNREKQSNGLIVNINTKPLNIFTFTSIYSNEVTSTNDSNTEFPIDVPKVDSSTTQTPQNDILDVLSSNKEPNVSLDTNLQELEGKEKTEHLNCSDYQKSLDISRDTIDEKVANLDESKSLPVKEDDHMPKATEERGNHDESSTLSMEEGDHMPTATGERGNHDESSTLPMIEGDHMPTVNGERGNRDASSTLPMEEEDHIPTATGERGNHDESKVLPMIEGDNMPTTIGERGNHDESSTLRMEEEDHMPTATGERGNRDESSTMSMEEEDHMPTATGERGNCDESSTLPMEKEEHMPTATGERGNRDESKVLAMIEGDNVPKAMEERGNRDESNILSVNDEDHMPTDTGERGNHDESNILSVNDEDHMPTDTGERGNRDESSTLPLKEEEHMPNATGERVECGGDNKPVFLSTIPDERGDQGRPIFTSTPIQSPLHDESDPKPESESSAEKSQLSLRQSSTCFVKTVCIDDHHRGKRDTVVLHLKEIIRQEKNFSKHCEKSLISSNNVRKPSVILESLLENSDSEMDEISDVTNYAFNEGKGDAYVTMVLRKASSKNC
jgi:hypothetical protein